MQMKGSKYQTNPFSRISKERVDTDFLGIIQASRIKHILICFVYTLHLFVSSVLSSSNFIKGTVFLYLTGQKGQMIAMISWGGSLSFTVLPLFGLLASGALENLKMERLLRATSQVEMRDKAKVP